ncbi:hypothetical protein ABZ554_12180 [Streptomyces sp. NPDC020125]|uniref:hypothetical protein n=1 Tax=Streptomyces sp. NPDC020125 TaxID=3154593 RepID=UPI0034022911
MAKGAEAPATIEAVPRMGTAALTMNTDLGLSGAVFCFATSIFSAGYIALQIPSNLALHRLRPGPRPGAA